MKKSKITRYLAYVTLILILFCLLPGGSLAARDSSDHGSGIQHEGENVTDSENSEKDSAEDVNNTDNSYPDKVQSQDETKHRLKTGFLHINFKKNRYERNSSYRNTIWGNKRGFS